MRLLFQGDIFGPRLNYYIQLGFSNGDTEPDLRLPLRDATVFWAPLRDLNVRFGQMKVPFGRQRVVSSSAMQMVDRALAVGELNLDRDVGVVLFSRDFLGLGRRLQYHLGVFGGDGRNRMTGEYGMLFVGRVQLQPFGEYDDLVEADVQRRRNVRAALGFSAAYNQNSRRARSTFGDTFQRGFDQAHLCVDVQLKWAGFFLQAEWLYRRASEDFHDLGVDAAGRMLREASRSGAGYYVQAGYLTAPGIELGARWGEVYPFGGTSPAFRRSRELGVSLSWYVQRHDLKFQADHFYLVDGDDFSAGRDQFRLQAQLYF
jgi:phosphate-selective porin